MLPFLILRTMGWTV